MGRQKIHRFETSMKKIKIVVILLAMFMLGLSSCMQKPCPTYTKADVKQEKQGKW